MPNRASAAGARAAPTDATAEAGADTPTDATAGAAPDLPGSFRDGPVASQHRRALEGWLEPLEAYRRLRDRGALLLDGMGAHPEARFAFVALHPRLEARFHGDRLRLTHDDGSQEERRGDPMELLRGLTDAYVRVAPPPDEAHTGGASGGAVIGAVTGAGPGGSSGFTGGFVGYFGYEWSRAVEPSLPPPRRPPETPDAVLRLCRDVVVFDRREKTMEAWSTDLEGEDGAPARLETVAALLAATDDGPRRDGADRGPADAAATWTPSMDQARFEASVGRLRRRIREGDLFQANLATRFSTPLETDPADLFAAMRQSNPSPFMALMDFGDHAVVSNSPEQLFAVHDGVIRSRPIAGTRPRSPDPDEDARLEADLLADPKEQAEHTMLVDLVRNDIAKVSRPGTVRVAERMSVERYSHVMHLVSRVEGEVRAGTGFTDWLSALFPGGTITGAPKHRACLRIHEEEPVARGPYTGSAGYLGWSGDTHWNILIRTLVLQGGQAHVHAGSGIVMDSDPTREWHEAGRKAQALLDAATGGTDGRPTRPTPGVQDAQPGPGPGVVGRLGEVTRHGHWSAPRPPRRVTGVRVLVVDNYDSFVWNLADYCAALGAQVKVVRNDEDRRAVMAGFRPTHVVLSPGPGWPSDAGMCARLAREVHGKMPLLGVCLGHQVIGELAGGGVGIHHEAVHGKTSAIHHDGAGLFSGLASPIEATRYHSLVVDPAGLGPGWRIDARLDDGTVMAVRHQEAPTFGVQFHPESLCTDRGLEIVLRFLES